MIGFLGLVGWKVTVISSNFIALMLILTMAMNIHMSTRYLQLSKQFPEINKFEILTLTTRKMIWPIFYTVITTICAFMSLIFSEIKPIIDFGWMMTFGLVSSLTITFTLVPSLLNFVKNSNITLAKNKDSKIIWDCKFKLLSIKPQHLNDITEEDHIQNKDNLIVSILAGVSLNRLTQKFPNHKCVRVVTNIPIIIGKGLTGISWGEEITEDQKIFTKKLFENSSKVYELVKITLIYF